MCRDSCWGLYALWRHKSWSYVILISVFSAFMVFVFFFWRLDIHFFIYLLCIGGWCFILHFILIAYGRWEIEVFGVFLYCDIVLLGRLYHIFKCGSCHHCATLNGFVNLLGNHLGVARSHRNTQTKLSYCSYFLEHSCCLPTCQLQEAR